MFGHQDRHCSSLNSQDMEKIIFGGGHFGFFLEALPFLGPITNLKVLGQAITTKKIVLLSGVSS